MGAAFYISIENPPPDFDHVVDGKSVCRVADKLNEHLEAKGVKKLADFFSQNPSELLDLLTDCDREIVEENGLDMLPKEEWFSPSEGLETIRECLRWAKTTPDVPDEVLNDLERFEALLTEADKQGLRWHLSVDY